MIHCNSNCPETLVSAWTKQDLTYPVSSQGRLSKITDDSICHFFLLTVQPTASTTDYCLDGRSGKILGKRVGEVFFLFAKINKRTCGLQVMIENIFNVWRYCNSNLTLFHVQISFLSVRLNMRFKKIAFNSAFCSRRTSIKQNI